MKEFRQKTLDMLVQYAKDNELYTKENKLSALLLTTALFEYKYPNKKQHEYHHLIDENLDRIDRILNPRKNGPKTNLKNGKCKKLFDLICDFLYEHNEDYRHLASEVHLKDLALKKFEDDKRHIELDCTGKNLFFEKVPSETREYTRVNGCDRKIDLRITPSNFHEYIHRAAIKVEKISQSPSKEESVTEKYFGFIHFSRTGAKLTLMSEHKCVSVDGLLSFVTNNESNSDSNFIELTVLIEPLIHIKMIQANENCPDKFESHVNDSSPI